jgi:hypothetical protein
MRILRPRLLKSIDVNLSASQQRLLAIFITAVPLLLLAWTAGFALSDMLDYHGRLAVLKRERAIYEDLIRGYPARKLTIAEIGHSGAQNAFFAGLDSQDAGRQLDRRLQQILLASHVTASVHDVGANANSAAVVALSEHLAFSCDIESLTHILARIAEERPLLFVDHLAITDVAGEARERGPHVLNVDLLVSAYKRSGP